MGSTSLVCTTGRSVAQKPGRAGAGAPLKLEGSPRGAAGSRRPANSLRLPLCASSHSPNGSEQEDADRQLAVRCLLSRQERCASLNRECPDLLAFILS